MANLNDNISDLYNKRKGTVNVFGAGPSLFHVDLKKLEKNDVIYVNSAGMVIPKKFDETKWKIWLSVDCLCVKWTYFWDSVITSNCVKLGKREFSKYDSHLKKSGFRYFKSRKGKEIKDIFDENLCSVSSIPAAIDLALKIGYEKILLFGVDQRFIQGKSHFWQFYPPKKQPKFTGGKNIGMREQKERFDENIPYFQELKRVADDKNVQIYNCAKRTTALEIFPKLRIDQGLAF